MRRDGERCLRLLVEGGAKINAAEQKSGSTALHLAVKENLFKVACTLITEVPQTPHQSRPRDVRVAAQSVPFAAEGGG